MGRLEHIKFPICVMFEVIILSFIANILVTSDLFYCPKNGCPFLIILKQITFIKTMKLEIESLCADLKKWFRLKLQWQRKTKTKTNLLCRRTWKMIAILSVL